MRFVRRLLAQRTLAVLLCAITLTLKLAVPTGYMLANDGGRVAMTVCSGVASPAMMNAMPGMHDGTSGHGKVPDHGKSEQPCAFAGLSAAVLAAVDPIQLAGLIAFVLAIGLLPLAVPRLRRSAHLRPPLRGPPAAL